jgi:hypothetical protein
VDPRHKAALRRLLLHAAPALATRRAYNRIASIARGHILVLMQVGPASAAAGCTAQPRGRRAVT